MNHPIFSPRLIRAALLCCSAVWVLSACSSKDIDPNDLPAELVKFEKTIKVKQLWKKGIGGDTKHLRLALRPAEHGDTLFVAGHNGRIRAMSLAKGKRKWQAKTELPLSAGPATDGEIVVAGSNNGDVIALDAATGDFLWAVTVTSEVLAAPVVVPGKVIVRTVNGKLAALDSRTGEQLWSIQQSMPRLSLRGTSTPVVARNLVICGFDNGRISAVDIADGGIVWDVLLAAPSGRTAIERLIDMNSEVQVAGSDVYAVSYQGKIAAIAIESGQLLWAQDLSSYNGMTVDFNTLYVADARSELLAMSRSSGRELWRRKDVRNRDVTAPAIIGGSVVVGDFEGYLFWFDIQTGDLQARVQAGSDRIMSQPLVVNDILYVMNDDGDLYAYAIQPNKKKR